MMPTHALSLNSASPFLDDVIISRAVEKNARELEAMFKHHDVRFYPECGVSCYPNRAVVTHLRLLQETNKMFHNHKQHLVLSI